MRIANSAIRNFLSVSVLICSALIANAEVLNGTVVGISDGDTITVLDKLSKEHKVRLISIDAPEKSQAFAIESKQTLTNYIYKKEVSVEYKKYDRQVQAHSWKSTLDEQDICLQMIRNGMAWHYTEFEQEQSKTDKKLYREAESIAREVKSGLWSEKQPVSPWIFRHK
jgi:endonuclease YncB( thermonuclease family)